MYYILYKIVVVDLKKLEKFIRDFLVGFWIGLEVVIFLNGSGFNFSFFLILLGKKCLYKLFDNF